MHFIKCIRLSLAFVISLCSLGFSQSLIQKLDDFGYVDWGRFVIGSSGVSSITGLNQTADQRIQALENAKQAATKKLAKAAETLTFNSNVRVKDALMRKSLSLPHLHQIVQGFTLVDTRSLSDMSIEVDIELRIIGRLSDVLLPKDCGQAELRLSDKLLCPTCGQPWPDGKPVPEGVKLVNLAEGLLSPTGTPYTGLIIDARGLGVNPAIAPKILNEDGMEIFGTNYVDRDKAIESGMVAYTKAGQNEQRVGSEPLLIRAVAASGPLKADVIVSNNDSALIHSAAHIQNFLKECKVVFII